LEQRSWGDIIPPATRVRVAIVSALFLFVYWGPIRYGLIGRWLNDDNWSHGWLIPVFALYFLTTRRDELQRAEPRPSYVGALVLALSLTLCFVSAWRWKMGYPQALSIVGALIGLTLLLGGWSVLRVAWFPIAYLLLAIPLPRSLYVEVTRPLRVWASASASAILPLIVPGLHTDAQAVVIDWIMPDGRFGTLNIEEACSGMRLLMAFVALGVAIAYLGDRPTWQRVVVVASCLPIAIFCNTIRVVVTGWLYVNGHNELAHGTPHMLLGILVLGVALGLFSLLAYVLSRLYVEVPSDD